MNNLMVKQEGQEVRITSIELVELINNFRDLEGNRKVLEHRDFMKKIRKELDALELLGLDNGGNISSVEYTDKKGESRPCFSLNRDGMLQMLNSESTLVRYKTIEYINTLEQKIKEPQIRLTEEEELSLKILNGTSDAVDLKRYKDIVQFKALKGENAMLNATQVVNLLKVNVPDLTTTLLHEWFEHKELGVYKKIGKEKKRTFQPNDQYMKFVAGEGHALTRPTTNTKKVYVQYTSLMVGRIMNHHMSSLINFVNSRVQ
ncbi:MAG: hypothetical protein ACRDDY_04705 [Clostridium sp.]|uniref:hypothetical protein n=1 Tax=Clostridium sp. TaxID=1506 RepID=UPI003EE7E5CE